MDSPTRVMHILPDLRIGGGQMVVRDAIACGDRDRFEVHVATLGPVDEMGDRFRAIDVEPVDCARSSPAATLRALVTAVRSRDAHVLHVHSPVSW